MLLPEIAKIYGVLVDDLFKPTVRGYDNNAHRLMAVYERTGKPEDFLEAAEEFERVNYAMSVEIPEMADTASLTAKIENGILTVVMKKRPETQPKKIEIL